ncbi:uncharacterized protein YegP (UPF0339 family) [Arthrobacter pascens]|uniref:YegP family protein n=1 Tax=Arthrobacter pascens TaxID=1677 RepID=UPI002793F8D7|nr:DUF1508 domain-containing protein [Arthrobacter pascens]MDQ0680203.1 uncharacterized protein YegP (UPF0339 family) [Arthrobacter pascens]
MAGMFEVFMDVDSHFRFQLKAADGTVMAVSAAYEDKSAAVAGIAAVRECAGMGLITDLCPAGKQDLPSSPDPDPFPQACDDQRIPANSLRVFALPKAICRSAATARWTGAA